MAKPILAQPCAVSLPLTPAEIQMAREWLAELEWLNADPDDFAHFSDASICRGIKNHWDGGIESFKRSCVAVQS